MSTDLSCVWRGGRMPATQSVMCHAVTVINTRIMPLAAGTNLNSKGSSRKRSRAVFEKLLQTEAGRSTNSPAAIWWQPLPGNMRMRLILYV